MIIACDVDGVCADILTPWLKWYNSTYKPITSPFLCEKDIKEWDMAKAVPPAIGNRIYDYLEIPKIYDNILPMLGSREAIDRLRSQGHRVIFATSTNVFQGGEKLRWLEKHGYLALYRGFSSDYIECTDKSLLRANLLIDDYPKNLETFIGHKILYAQSYNQGEYRFPRLTWDTIPNALKEIECQP
jgi:5'-nucleotidase